MYHAHSRIIFYCFDTFEMNKLCTAGYMLKTERGSAGNEFSKIFFPHILISILNMPSWINTYPKIMRRIRPNASTESTVSDVTSGTATFLRWCRYKWALNNKRILYKSRDYSLHFFIYSCLVTIFSSTGNLCVSQNTRQCLTTTSTIQAVKEFLMTLETEKTTIFKIPYFPNLMPCFQVLTPFWFLKMCDFTNHFHEKSY
jgi:hypothetical protein